MKRKHKKSSGKDIRQNRPGWRKEVIGHKDSGNKYQKPIKIKGKKYIKIE